MPGRDASWTRQGCRRHVSHPAPSRFFLLLTGFLHGGAQGSVSHPVNVQLPPSFSLAGVTSGNAILTVAKAGQLDPAALILRLYQPSNTSQTVALSLAGYLTTTGASSPRILPVTALEQAIPGATALPLVDGGVSLTMPNALATLSITES